MIVLSLGHLQREANEIQVFQPLPSHQWFFRWPIFLMLFWCKITCTVCIKTEVLFHLFREMAEEACMLEQLPYFLLHRPDD